MNYSQKEFHVNAPRILPPVSMFFGGLAVLWTIFLIIKPLPEVPLSLLPYAIAGCFLLAVLFLGGGWYGWTHPSLALRFTKEGLWVQKNKVLLPWDAIAFSEVVCPYERRSSGERLLQDAVGIAINRRSNRDVFLTITLSEKGRNTFRDFQFENAATMKALMLHEDIFFPLHSLPLGDRLPELATEITRRANLDEPIHEAN